MNKPLIAAWVSAVIGLVAMRLLMGGNQVVAECAFGVQVGFVAALFFASTVLFERGARQSPNSVRRISAWVMCAFLLLTSVVFRRLPDPAPARLILPTGHHAGHGGSATTGHWSAGAQNLHPAP